LTVPTEITYGAAREYQVQPRCTGGNPGYFRFTEQFHKVDPNIDPQKNFDAILVLGARLNHDYSTPNQDVVNSWMWNGFSKLGRRIVKLWIKEITVSFSEPSSIINTYTEAQSTVGSVDNGWDDMPDHASDGVLAHLWVRHYYNNELTPDLQTLYWKETSPVRWVYPWLLTTMPLSFYHKTLNFGEEAKPQYVLWKITAGVRFHTSAKSQKFSKTLELGGMGG